MTLYVQSEGTATRRKFTFVCVDDTDGKTPETGLTFSTSEVALRKAGTTSYTAITNIATITEIGDGEYEGEFTATELNTLGPLVVRIKKTGVRTTIIAVGQVILMNVYGSPTVSFTNNSITANVIAAGAIDASSLASDAITAIQSGLATSTDLATVDGNVDAIKTKTDLLPAVAAGSGAGGLIVGGTGSGGTLYVEPGSESAAASVYRWKGTVVPVPTVAGIPRVELASSMDDAITAIQNGLATEATVAALPDASDVVSTIMAYSHDTGLSILGLCRRLDALIAGKATGLRGTVARYFMRDNESVAIEAAQDVNTGSRAAADVTDSEV